MTKSDLREHDPPGTRYVAELQCFLCGSLAGTVESDRNPIPLSSMWHPADGGPPHVVQWRYLRCARCGGALMAESVDAVIRHQVLAEEPREQPRRGRPPRWLVEERVRQHESSTAGLP